MKKIYIEPTARLHSAYREIIKYPPEGYEFVSGQGILHNTIGNLSRSSFIYHTLPKIVKSFVPPHLLMSYLGKFQKIPEGADLTFSCGHLILRDEPWVTEVEWVIQLVWFRMKYLRKYKRLLEKTLSYTNCKNIICMSELTKKTFLWHLDCTGFEHKLETIYRVVPPKTFVKSYNNDKVRLFFAGSANFPGEFENEKGGLETLEVFNQLSKKYDNLEFVIRSDITENLRSKYEHLTNLRIIDHVLTWEELEQEFKAADIFVLPAHHTPSMAFLDAMSYELPVITIDSWANSEIVEDGKTGFVIKQPDGFQLPIVDFLPDREVVPVKRTGRIINPQLVNELVEKTGLLVENEELRRRMGKAARQEVEKGKFSINKRNEKLKIVFDNATI